MDHPVLGAPWTQKDILHLIARLREEGDLGFPSLIARFHPKYMAEEIFRARIFIEAPDQVSDRMLEFLFCGYRTIEEDVPRQFLHYAPNVVGHPFQHLETGVWLNAIFEPEQHRESDIE